MTGISEADGRDRFWLATSGDSLSPRTSLQGDVTADVVIVGGGYSGLWTAYHLLRGSPGLRIALVERRICGFGASGRNGGWCSPRFPVDAGALADRIGVAPARAVLLAQQGAVTDLGAACEREGIDAQYRPAGLLSIARGELQLASLRATWRNYERLGLGDVNRLLGAEEAFDRVHVTKLTGAIATDAGASIHPGRLVRGLARAIERMGATIYEETPATSVRTGAEKIVVTPGGTLRALRAVVMAGEAYLTEMPGFRRALLPMSSMIVLSEPLSTAQWEAVGWAGGESLSSQAHTKDYLTRTAEGRILYGSRGAPYLFGSAMPEDALQDSRTFAWMEGNVRDWWPELADLRFEHRWGGFLGVSRDWMPTVSFDPAEGLAQLHGYAGRGISTSFLAARLLAGLIGGWKTGLESLPLYRSRARLWEPEPFRWIGVRYVQNAYARSDEADLSGRKRPLDTIIGHYLGGS